MDRNKMGELEKEVKILDLSQEDLIKIDEKMQQLCARKVADYDRHIMTLDNGTSEKLNQLASSYARFVQARQASFTVSSRLPA